MFSQGLLVQKWNAYTLYLILPILHYTSYTPLLLPYLYFLCTTLLLPSLYFLYSFIALPSLYFQYTPLLLPSLYFLFSFIAPYLILLSLTSLIGRPSRQYIDMDSISNNRVVHRSLNIDVNGAAQTVHGKVGNAVNLNGNGQYLNVGKQTNSCFGNLDLCHHGLLMSTWLRPGQLREGMDFASTGANGISARYVNGQVGQSFIHSFIYIFIHNLMIVLYYTNNVALFKAKHFVNTT